jgi:hypothetical protein
MDGLKKTVTKVCEELIQEFNEDSDPNNIWASLLQGLKQAVADNIPHKLSKNKTSYPWVDPEIKKQIRKRDKYYAAWRKGGDQTAKEEHHKLKGEIQRRIRRSYWSFMNTIFTGNDSPFLEELESQFPNKKFWSYIKTKRSENSGISPLKDHGKLVTEPAQKAELLRQQFDSAFSKREVLTEEEFNKRCPPLIGPQPFRKAELNDINITTPGVQKILSNLNPNKACGPDGVSPRLLRLFATEIAPALTLLFRASLKTGIVPTDWRTAHVTPVFKKGEQYKPENYRPISLTSVPCKIMEHVIVHSLMDHLEQNNILRPEQHGFRKGRSCVSQLVGLVDEMTQEVESGNQEDIIALDFSKAFDKVNHSLLIHKLRRYGVCGKVNGWIEAFLSGRQQSVIVEGASSSPSPVESGVPQGSVLGPALFLTYINDLPEGTHSKVRLFADDTTCSNTIKLQSDQADLQQDLETLSTWEQQWSMRFHPKKCQVLNVVGRRKRREFDYQLHGEKLETTQELTYLGITISEGLSWKPHIRKITSRANRALGFLRRNLRISNKKLKETAYKSLVRPLLEYASPVWDPHHGDEIEALEKVQKRAARWSAHRYRRTSSIGEILASLEWPTLEERRKKARLETFYKFSKGLISIESQHLPRLKPVEANKRTTRGTHPFEYEEKHHPRDYRQKAFFPRTVSEWNRLPAEVVASESLSLFKARVSSHI